MSADRVYLDERYAFISTALDGGVLRHNCLERVSLDSPVTPEDITFTSEVGYGVSYYEIAPGAMQCVDPVEVANRIAAALPVDTARNTQVSLVRPDGDDPLDMVACVLLVWGSGSEAPQRRERFEAIKARWSDEAASSSSQFVQLERMQAPLIEHSRAYRGQVAERALAAVGVNIHNSVQVSSNDDVCVRRVQVDEQSGNAYLHHGYYAHGLDKMWVMHAPDRGASFYYRQEHVEQCTCDAPCNHGTPVSDSLKPDFETDRTVEFDVQPTVLVAGQPARDIPASGIMSAVVATDSDVTRFVPALTQSTSYLPSRPIDLAQGLAGYVEVPYEAVCTISGCVVDAGGKLYGRLEVDIDGCLQHTADHDGAVIVVPNDPQWMQLLFSRSPNAQIMHFLGDAGTEMIRREVSASPCVCLSAPSRTTSSSRTGYHGSCSCSDATSTRRTLR